MRQKTKVIGSNPVLAAVPDVTIRMTDVLHEMVVRIYTPQIEGGLNNNSSRRKNSDSWKDSNIVR